MANKIGKYELVRKLATGGMAEVFLAKFEWARGLEKTVVVKRILYHLAEDPTFVDMFFTEAQLASQLSHPNIAQIIEFGESEGIYFLAMEYIDGPSLRALSAAARQQGGLPFPHCARIAAFCCEALSHAHELTNPAGNPLNLVHRDVSPDNILISKTGAVKLVDFGIAKAATQNHQTKTGLVKGKLAYMSPEQLRAEPLDRRADVFSLGVVLYELIAGAKPYEAPSEITLIHAMLYEQMTPLQKRRADVPKELEQIVNKALERDRDQRYADCRAMHADLEEYLLSARQPVSALQIAQLVEKHRPVPGKADGPPPAMATPNRSPPPARTPEPWRAERTPARDATAELRKPLLKTGTDGDSQGAIAQPLQPGELAPATPVEKTEVIPPPKPLPQREEQPLKDQRHARRSTQDADAAPVTRSKSRVMVGLVAGSALLLLAGAIAFLRPSSSPSPQEPGNTPVLHAQGVGTDVATAPPPTPQPPQQHATSPTLATPASTPDSTPKAPKPTPPQPPAPTSAQAPTPASLSPAPTPTSPASPASALALAPTPTPASPPPTPKPTSPAPPVPASDRPARSATAPGIELVLRSEPPGLLKVIAGGKVKASQTSPLTTRLPPGLVDVELSGSAEGQPFAKRAQITLDPAQKHQEHTITVGKGTVQIRSFPASHVKIDGVPKGDTPLPVTLYEGEHVVQFECDRQTSKCTGLSDATKPVTVQAGKTVVLSHQWK